MTSDPTVLITGVGGQDGTLPAQEVSARGWRARGHLAPDTSQSRRELLAGLSGVSLFEADLCHVGTCRRIAADIRPDYVFHLAAISSVEQSWSAPLETSQINATAAIALMVECLETFRRGGTDVRFVNASSAEIFAGAGEVPQSERAAFAPVSPYGDTKAFAHMMAVVFRSRGLRVSTAILYNHESPLRPTTFVTRKITAGAAAIAVGAQRTLRLGESGHPPRLGLGARLPRRPDSNRESRQT